MPAPERQEIPPSHKPGLDGLRGVAVILIVLFHSWPQTFVGAYIGVDIFFVLSGYLITQILLRDHRAPLPVFLSQFYKRRALRLLPALWLVAAAMLPITLLAAPDTPHQVPGFLAAVFYITNWVRALGVPAAPFMGHTWSLSIEEQFYLLWPAMFLVLMTMPRRHAAFATFGLFLLAGLWRAYLAAMGASVIRLYGGLDTHADGLLMGCTLALAGSDDSVRLDRAIRAGLCSLVPGLAGSAGALRLAHLRPWPAWVRHRHVGCGAWNMDWRICRLAAGTRLPACAFPLANTAFSHG